MLKQESFTIVCELLPRPIDPGDLCLASEDTFGSDFSSNSRHLTRENLQLVHHGVDHLELS
jgi:hypothetical protein